jgi:ribose transport system substrate-binding protein
VNRDHAQRRVRRLFGQPGITLAAALVAAGPLLGACSGPHSAAATAAASSGGTASGAGTAPDAAGNQNRLQLAFFAFAVQNSYEAPMIAAAQQAAAAENAQLTMFDGQSDAQTQFGQIQDAIASGKYSGFLVDAVDGAGLVPLVQQALGQHIKVVAVNDVLGANLRLEQPQVPGVSASIVYTGFSRGQHLGTLLKEACAAVGSATCKVGYMYDVKASAFDQGVRAGLESVISSDTSIEIVAEGQDEFTATGGFAATETMLQSQPDINVIVGTDQGMEGATRAVAAAGKTGQVKIIGMGGSVAGLSEVKSGAWFGDVSVLPATQGQVALQALVRAVRQGVNSGGINPSASLPDGGIATRANVSKFTGQWSG